MHTATFLQDLEMVMIVAGLVTVVCHRLKQPVVLGYIIAGVIIGPHTPTLLLVHRWSLLTDRWHLCRIRANNDALRFGFATTSLSTCCSDKSPIANGVGFRYIFPVP